MKAIVLIALAVTFLPVSAAGTDVEALAADLRAASRSYDAGAATVLLAELREMDEAETGEALALRVRAGLVLAEIHRVAFEQSPRDQHAKRQLIGQQVDSAAREALALVDRLAESSERERLRADLLATLIRSDFRAKKHEPALRTAIARALELDPDNPKALVAGAKPALFADPKRGGDTEEAIRLLDQALELDPELESAMLLRAHAFELIGDSDRALAEWQKALELNPGCQPAAWRIQNALGTP